MDKNSLAIRLKGIRPLVFKLKSGHYCIGIDQFRQCTDVEEQLYESLMREFLERKSTVYCLSSLTERDVEEICEIYRNMRAEIDSPYSDANKNAAAQKIGNLIRTIEDEDYNAIIEQLQCYESIWNLECGAFYRESVEYKKLKANESECFNRDQSVYGVDKT